MGLGGEHGQGAMNSEIHSMGVDVVFVVGQKILSLWDLDDEFEG